jgi:phage terminase large subunit
MAVTFSRKFYNPLYFILNDILKDTSIRTVLVYGGKSSSKTISICQVLAKEAYINLVNSIAFRKQSAIIPTTLKKSFNLAIDSQYLYPAFSKQDRRYLCIGQNGEQSEIVLRGLDDPEKAKGIESYKYVYLDELNHFEQSEYDQFNLSLRGIEGQKIIASWNPTDELSWVKTKLIDSYTFVKSDKYELPNPDSFVKISTDGKCILIKTNYLDNYWIVGSPDGSYGYKDVNLMSEYYDLQFKNPMSYRVNVLGEWGKVVFGGEFLKDFNSGKHVKLIQYNSQLPLHIVFDENVNPYITMLVWQIDGFNAYQIDELCLVDPYNRRHHLCNEFKKRYPVHQVKGLFVYGDRTSKKEDTAKEKGENFYTDVFKYLVDYRPVLRLQSVNPSVVQSGGFINQIFSGNQNVTIAISSKCTTSIYDYEHTLEDSDGTMKKSKKKNPITGVTYEEHGHCVDCCRYLITKCFEREYLIYTGKKKRGIKKRN